jgi:hypothetical protein
VKELKENPKFPVLLSSSEPAREDYLKTYADALTSDPIGMTRSLVGACRKSGQRRIDLRKVIEDGNSSGMWKVPVRQLLRDVDTRWSAIYQMINRVIDIYEGRDIINFLMIPH